MVDDDPEIRELLALFLREHGFEVDVAADGAAMFLHLQAGARPDCAGPLCCPGRTA